MIKLQWYWHKRLDPNGQHQAPVTDISRALVYTPPAQYWSLHHTHSRVDLFFLSCGVCVSPPTTFHQYAGGGKKIPVHTGDKTLSFSHMNHESVGFVVLDCEPRSEMSKDFSWWLRLVEKDGPLRQDEFIDSINPTKSSFFVLKVENIMIKLTIYVYTTYMLNTVNIFSFLYIWFSLLLLPETVHQLFYVPLLKHYSVPAWMTSNAAVWKNKISTLSRRKKRSPEAVFRRWEEQGRGILFLSSRRLFMRCFTDKIHPKTLMLLHFYV